MPPIICVRHAIAATLLRAMEGEVRAGDGYPLAVRFFTPTSAPRGAVLIVPAMGVSQGFYAPLAEWLSGEGYLCATFDYRGMGQSRRGSLVGFEADLRIWAEQDCAAVLAALTERAGAARLFWLGHSLGGQIFPFVENRDGVVKMVTVATGSGYWRENTPRLRLTVWWLWFVAVPLSLWLFGYFPGRRLRKIGDLPHGVMAQWRRWCLHRDYAAGAEGDAVRQLFASVRTPITSLSFTDDEYMSARNIETIHALYAGAPRVMKRFAPADLGARRIGHFGFFRPRFEGLLWRDVLLPELA